MQGDLRDGVQVLKYTQKLPARTEKIRLVYIFELSHQDPNKLHIQKGE